MRVNWLVVLLLTGLIHPTREIPLSHLLISLKLILARRRLSRLGPPLTPLILGSGPLYVIIDVRGVIGPPDEETKDNIDPLRATVSLPRVPRVPLAGIPDVVVGLALHLFSLRLLALLGVINPRYDAACPSNFHKLDSGRTF